MAFNLYGRKDDVTLAYIATSIDEKAETHHALVLFKALVCRVGMFAKAQAVVQPSSQLLRRSVVKRVSSASWLASHANKASSQSNCTHVLDTNAVDWLAAFFQWCAVLDEIAASFAICSDETIELSHEIVSCGPLDESGHRFQRLKPNVRSSLEEKSGYNT